MADLPGITISKTAVSQNIDLSEIVGVSFAGESGLRQQAAQLLIDYMKTRTHDRNVDVDGKAFPKYSEAYKNSTVFKLLKGSGGDVNMTLTGNMLGDVDMLGDTADSVRIGFRDGNEILKAFNHNTGDTVPRRAFFGVTKREIREVLERGMGEDIQRLRSMGPKTVADVLGDTVARAATSTSVRNLVFRTVWDVLNG